MRYLVILMALFIGNKATANTVVFNQTFIAQELVVVSPGVMNIVTNFDDKTELANFNYYIDGIDYEGVALNQCDNDTASTACQLLMSFIEDKEIKFHITDFNEKTNLFTGQLYVNGDSLKDVMIKEGWYRYDYTKGRSRYLSILQKEAKCNARGIWKSRYSPLTELECN